MIKTVGELRAAMAEAKDDDPLWLIAFGSKNSVAEVAYHEGEVLIRPAGLGDIIMAAERESVTVT